MDINNQMAYWNKVAGQKTFTHPLDFQLLKSYVPAINSIIIDYGCGYGRLVEELITEGYSDVNGYDTSEKLIERGISAGLPLHHIPNADALPIEDNSVDAILLFAVLTCIPGKDSQTELINLLYHKLKPGGIIYVSDYYLQANSSRYLHELEDHENYGLFSLPEGAILRHHSKDWIKKLFSCFTISEERMVDVRTMNGNPAQVFQLIGLKTTTRQP